MTETGRVSVERENGIGTVRFFHPRSNSLPGALLRETADRITEVGKDESIRVIVLASEGSGAFCAGASFDELKTIDNTEKGREFFMGFAKVILAMKSCPQFVVARIQGKAVGGGVGLAASADYALATRSASVKLSELAVGIGPFVVGPAVERKVGNSAFGALSIDTEWRDAQWALAHGLYHGLCDNEKDLDTAVSALAGKLAASSRDAMRKIKEILWHGTENWSELLPQRAAISGTLVVTQASQDAIRAASAK
jgi:methylglutaconyl-CoA hydratase